jgi:PhnB protein
MSDITRPAGGYATVTPYMLVKDAAGAIEFYKTAFGATELMRAPAPDGSGLLMHAEIKIGDSRIMLADECPEKGLLGPQARGGSPMFITLNVADPDGVAKKAVAAGAKLTRPMQDQDYGRCGSVLDPFGYTWWICRF